ncbi:MAG: hypothetical protein AB1646_08680 [Thermodesulfobacteriota bacterium]
MTDNVVTIPIDAETARAYCTAPSEVQEKIRILLGLRLRELTDLPTESLSEIMDEIGAQAEERGLTPEILETLLRDE